MDRFDVKGKNALVIGAGGIGGAIAQALAEGGACVLLADISQENMDKVAKAGGLVKTRVTNINSRAEVEALFAWAKGEVANLDMLVNAAGINKGAPAVEMEEGDWDEVLGHFLNSVFWCCQQAARWMLPRKHGKILNIASMSGVVCTGDTGSSYAAAKAAVIQLTSYLACEWIKEGVYVNAISPGNVKTALTDGYFAMVPGLLESLEGQTPIGRIAQPEDMVGPALFLLSKASDYVVGQNLLVDGGYTLR